MTTYYPNLIKGRLILLSFPLDKGWLTEAKFRKANGFLVIPMDIAPRQLRFKPAK